MAKKQYKNKNRWIIAVQKHQKILQMLRAGESIRRTARVVGVGHHTVQRRKAIVDAEVLAEIGREVDRDAVAYRDVRWRCPVHGWVSVQPCVMCTSLAAMDLGVDAIRTGVEALRN